MRSSPTIPVRPSVHIRIRSPGWSSTVRSSTSTSASTPSARVRMLRWGWRSASSVVSFPSRTMRCTSVWSSVIIESSPSRNRYARESPTWATRASEPSRISAVRVVPIPSSSGSSAAC
jgi:hypothetical protein